MSTIIFNDTVIPSDQACIKHNDRGLALGHGLFETILVKKGTIPLLDYHWKRVKTSAPIIGLKIPFSYTHLKSMIEVLIEKNELHNKIAGARLTITHGEAGRGILPSETRSPNFIISVFEYAHTMHSNYSALISSIRKNEHSPSCNIKSTSYLDNILAKQEAIDSSYNEAILLNTASNVADGAISNIFMVKQNKIITPKLSDGALPGVIRSVLLTEFQHSFSIDEQSISMPELLDADEVFITNALMGIQPLHRINDRIFHPFPIATMLANTLREKQYVL